MQIDLPIPRPGVPGDCPRYPFDRLALGDSFRVHSKRAGLMTVREMVRRRNAKGLGAFAVAAGEDPGWTVVTRVS